MSDRELEPLLATSHFRVLIGRREIGFAEVGRLTSVTDHAAPAARRTHRYETVVLRRALGRSTELHDWRRSILDGKDDRRDVIIEQLDGPGGDVVGAFRLLRAWPCRWSGPAFNALESSVAYEELELAFDDAIWTINEGG